MKEIQLPFVPSNQQGALLPCHLEVLTVILHFFPTLGT